MRTQGWASSFCGVEIDRTNADYVSGVSMSEASLDYDRVLVPEEVVNGEVVPAVTCQGPTECTNLCTLMEKTAREGLLPAPSACALCNPPCPSNAGTSAADFSRALVHDIDTAIQLARICLGPNGFRMCLCNVITLLRPAWMDNIEKDNPRASCKVGDAFSLIVDKVKVAAAEVIEKAVNHNIVRPVNAMLKIIPGFKLDELCIDAHFLGVKAQYKRCNVNEQDLGCSEDDPDNPHLECYYQRQRSICMSNSGRYNAYKELFDAPTASDLKQEFIDVVGDQYEALPPSLQSVFEDIDRADAESGVKYNPEAADICDYSLSSSMTLDETILMCIFTLITSYCSDSESPERFDTFLKTIDFRLPDVVFDWSAAPPPPPPITDATAFRRLVAGDPDGVELVREKMLDCWPSLPMVATQVFGSNVGRDRSSNGLGYGPLYFVTRFSMSTAYLSTAHFEDQDALSARLIQGRFSGMFRFSCRCFLDWSSDPTTAAAGIGEGTDPNARLNNPPEFGGCVVLHQCSYKLSCFTQCPCPCVAGSGIATI